MLISSSTLFKPSVIRKRAALGIQGEIRFIADASEVSNNATTIRKFPKKVRDIKCTSRKLKKHLRQHRLLQWRLGNSIQALVNSNKACVAFLLVNGYKQLLLQ